MTRMAIKDGASKHAVELQDVSNYLNSSGNSPKADSSNGEQQAPSHAVHALERWNQSRTSIFKTLSTFFGFTVMGANDAAYGAIIPYLGPYYNVSYTVVSLVFLSPLIGYVTSAMLNNYIHKTLGQRGIAIIGPTAHLVAYVIICLHPPYPVLVVSFILAGFANGILDAAWNAWIGGLANPNEILGFLHGFYGLGAVLSPLIATALITQAKLGWWSFYYIMIGGAIMEMATGTAAFWHESGARYRASMSNEQSTKGATRAALKTRVAWVSAIFLLIYVGIEVSLGGWIVQFMLEVRNGKNFESGLSAMGFWLGITVGRLVLGFITPKIGENLSICIYLLCAMAMQLLFWLVPSFIVSSIAVGFVGFFLGPLFPAVVVAVSKLLPSHLHVPTIGFAAAFGGGGAAVLPFGIGAMAQAVGVKVLQPVIIGFMGAAFLLWTFGMPRIGASDGADKDKLGHVKTKVHSLFLGCFAARL